MLYIGGFGRSGSTLLERVLGQAPGVSATGEVIHLWDRGVLHDERCGCGERFSHCPFWTAVGVSAFGGWRDGDATRVVELKRRVDRTRNIPLLLLPRLRASFRRDVQALSRLLGELYRGEYEASGADVLVDSSKHASYAFLLRRVPVDLRVVHLVRDSCGVSYSWSKRVRKPETVDEESYMPTFTPFQTSLYWAGNNAAFHLLAKVGVPVLRVRYEDLLRDPDATVRSILRFAGCRDGAAVGIGAGKRQIELRTDHTVAGNPMRFKVGPLELRLDEEWRSKMPRRDRRTVSLLTFPLRARYGYWRRDAGY